MNQTLAMLLLAAAGLMPSSIAKAVVTVTVDPSANWIGYMNVFELPENGGSYVFGSSWGTADLVATFDGPFLTLAPNSINDPNEFWYIGGGGPGAPGNKTLEANMYIEDSAALVGEVLIFEGTVVSNSFTAAHSTVAFIKDYAPDYTSSNIITAPLTVGDFSITLATDPTPGRHVQYGFATTGPNVWITDITPFGVVEVIASGVVQFEADFTGDGRVNGLDLVQWQGDYSDNADSDADGDEDSDGADFLTWQRQSGLGTDDLAGLNAVPEPPGITLLAALTGLLAARTCRRAMRQSTSQCKSVLP